MPLFGRKKPEDAAPVRPAWDPLPLPPPARPDGLRSLEDHRDYLLSCVQELPPFGQQLLDAVDLALCEEIVSPISLPGFDNTAMDGYAVRAQDVAAATPEAPVRMPRSPPCGCRWSARSPPARPPRTSCRPARP